LCMTGAQRSVRRKGVILTALVVGMASRTSERLGQRTPCSVDSVPARGRRVGVASSTGPFWLHQAQLMAGETGYPCRPTVCRPAVKILAVACLAEAEIEAGVEQQCSVKIRLIGIQNPGGVPRGRLFQ